jgi:hypothetical protein
MAGRWLAKYLNEGTTAVRSEVSHDAPTPPEPVTMAGQVIALHRMRDTCQAAGHCLGYTTEVDCNLYPVRLGWCRERLPIGGSK